MLKRYTHLTYDDRCQIYALKKSGILQNEIAVFLNVSQSTISRELRRNRGLRGYRHKQAHDLAKIRGSAVGRLRHVLVPDLIIRVEACLVQKQWSPQQIAHRLKLETGTQVSHESIYRHIWADKRRGGSLFKHLRQKGKKRNTRAGKNAGRGMIPNRIDIAQRPTIVDAKIRVGDWELDSIIGAKHRGAITTMVDRVTKLARLVLLESPTSFATTKAIIESLKPMKNHVLTLTSDNGKEFAGHCKVSAELSADFFFATPYHAWERGLNENTNGLIRQYFPKGADFAKLTAQDVQKVEDLLNNRPRKTLNYLTPNEVFSNLTNQPNHLCT